MIKRIRKIIKQINYHDYRVIIVISFLLILLGWGGYVLTKKLIYYFSKQTYEAVIVVRNQYNPDPIQDAKTSLKYGDVLALKEEGHNWSEIERISYLIIKLELNRSQAAKITQSKYQKTKYENLTEEERRELNERLKNEGLKEVPREVMLARQYRINMEENFKDFDPLVLLHKQPYQYQVYDWGVVERK